MSFTRFWQSALPHHPLSRLVLRLTRIRHPAVKNALIGAFLRGYDVDMNEAEQTDPRSFASFNDFFTRSLKSSARVVEQGADLIASPVDGAVSQATRIDSGRILQAKGQHYTLSELLAGAAASWEPQFTGGEFATIYLAPFNYHRIHMPCDGTLRDAWYVPGRLFSVNTASAAAIPGLFARNERIVLLFEGELGPFAVILVGALFVGSMSTVWHGDVAPRTPRVACQLSLPSSPGAPLSLRKGDELGRFNMGSTVILLFPPGRIAWDTSLVPGRVLRMGQSIGRRTIVAR